MIRWGLLCLLYKIRDQYRYEYDNPQGVRVRMKQVTIGGDLSSSDTDGEYAFEEWTFRGALDAGSDDNALSASGGENDCESDKESVIFLREIPKRTTQLKYRCSNCKFRCIKRDSMLDPLWRHLRRNPPCKICEKTFESVSSLKEHKVLFHFQSEFKCPICKSSFVNQRDVINHLSAVHNKKK
ncbi:hypothetical protein ONE63_001000 [Megalurothrips usitatus]|uniref:C2H2-type domain-containing protein n=1 Tax=Megalurothrips usitatus TaxID=439358 RepID=A0AAV7XHK6_9NEOP|nr:hypothetical protein ONE63_001000 [Megalurothrips usitatus]